MKEDHRRLEEIRSALSQLNGLDVPPSVDSNILYFETEGGPVLVEALEKNMACFWAHMAPGGCVSLPTLTSMTKMCNVWSRRFPPR